jgi:DNA-binding winged helix-turn-helix (wHTH) protein
VTVEVSTKIYEFGQFRLDPHEKVLRSGNSIMDVTPKAVEILCLLVENVGKIVSKEEIFERVWSDSFVEENNLSHHIFRLRKVLGETDEQKFIETVPKRGYRFVAGVREAIPDPFELSAPPKPENLVGEIKRYKVGFVAVLFILFLAVIGLVY